MSTTLQKKLSFGFSLLAFILVSTMGYSQTAGTAVTMSLTNAIQTSPTEFTYDVMLTNTGTTALYLRGYSAGVNFAAGMAGTGTLTHTFISRDPALASIPVVNPGVNLAVNHLRLTTINASAGNEYLMTAGTPIRLATMKVTNTVPFPADFNPAFNLQLITGAGKTQCIATCYVGTASTVNNYAINGTANPAAPATLQVLSGLVNTPCFFLNPSALFNGSAVTTPIVCFGQSTGTAVVTLSNTGSAAPTGTVGTYKINGGANIAYTGNPFTVSNLSAGTYSITVTTSYGCSKTVLASITQPSTVISTTSNASTCAASYALPWGSIVTATGAYTHTYVNGNGCDSIVTRNVTFNSSSVNAPTNAIACSSYLWSSNNQTYTASGTYTASFTNSVGCDSSRLLNLTVSSISTNPPVSVSVCNSYTWPINGNTYTASGTYVATFLNSAGCDSNRTLILTIKQSTSSTTTVSQAGSYTWAANGAVYSSTGIHTATLVNAAGCDSIATLNLTITGAAFTLTVVEDMPISCFGNNDGSALATAVGTGTYTYNVDGGSFTNTTGSFGGLTAGTHTICATDGTFTLCSTITFVNPAPLAISFVIDSTVSCHGNDGQITANITGGTNNVQPYLTLWTNSNTPPDTLNNQFTNNYDITISNLSVGTYHLSISDDNGCTLSSSVPLAATPPVSVTAASTGINCFGGSSVITASATGGEGNKIITIGGLPIASNYPAGTYTITATDTKGCTGTTVVVINQPSVIGTTSNISVCNSYTWPVNSATYTTSGLHSVTFTSASSCDSIVTLNLIIKQPSINPISTINACNSYTWPVNGVTYTNSGTRTASFINAAGCDSSFVLNLTINATSTTSTSITATSFYVWPVNGQTYTTSGVYTNTVLGGNGCVQTNILNLIINSATFYITDTVIQNISCKNNHDGFAQIIAHGGVPPYSYVLDGGVQSNNTGLFHNLTPGIHSVCATSGSLTACDTVFISEPDSLLAGFWGNLVSCHGNDGYLEIHIHGGTSTDPLSFNGGVGGVQDYLTWWMNAAGDTLNNPFTDNFAVQIGDTLTPGTYHVKIEDDNGCLYTAYVNLGQAPPVTVTATAAPITCFGGTSNIVFSGTGGVGLFDTIPPPAPYPNPSTLTYQINGVAVSPGSPYPAGPGTYTITATDAKLCSATTVLTISAPTGPIITILNQTACNSYTWSSNGATYTSSGVHTLTYTTAAGCDSTVTLNLTINLNTTTATTATSCNSYTWAASGLTYTSSGVYTFTSLNAAGCTNTATLILTINNSTTTGSLSATACDTYTWVTSGLTYTTSGVYTFTSLNASGCTNTGTLTLTINNSSTTGSLSATACNTYTWATSGLTYTTSGVYTFTSLNASGCTNTATLTLTINNSSTNGNITTSACDSYLWNGTTYTASGTYTVTSLNASGCTNTAVLSLTVNSSSVNPPTNVTSCLYTWSVNGVTYTTSGIYTATFQNAAGCDSSFTLTVSCPLPVSISRFIGYKGTSKDILEWTTGSELNNAYFNLQHGTDAINFSTLAKVSSKAPGGNSSIDIDYRSENTKPSIGHNYYRLQQVDLDGHSTYESRIVDLIWDNDGNSVTMYPNPTTDVLNIDLFATEASTTSVRISDMSGRTVKSVLLKSVTGMNNVTISLAELANGLYTVQIFTNDKLSFVQKVRKND